MNTSQRLLALLFLAALFLVAGCSRGDYLGPAERAARALGNGWDMWRTSAVQPHELPMPGTVAGMVPLSGKASYAKAAAQLKPMSPTDRQERAGLVYRRYCYHCHGVNGDGRIIVGESFDKPMPDLRSPQVQAKSDEVLYLQIVNGGPVMIPLRDTVAPVDILLAIAHVRTLANAPSQPFFPPQSNEPAR